MVDNAGCHGCNFGVLRAHCNMRLGGCRVLSAGHVRKCGEDLRGSQSACFGEWGYLVGLSDVRGQT